MLNRLIVMLYKIIPMQPLKKKYLYYFSIIQGGEMNSKIVRDILKQYYNIELGMGSYGVIQNVFSSFSGNGSFIKIGNYCSIAGDVKRFNANHPYKWASMNPLFYRNRDINQQIERSELYIGHDVWIGNGVKILADCKYIGNGAVVGAGSVVTKNIEPYTVYAGVPAKQIQLRFDSTTIGLLEQSKWWILKPDELIQFSHVVQNTKLFAEKVIERTSIY